MAIATVEPSTGRKLRDFTPHGPAELQARLARAAEAFTRWRQTPVGDRAHVIARAADILDREREAFGRLMTTEMGKLLRAAIEEVQKCATGCRHYAEHGPAMVATEMVEERPGVAEWVMYQPLGPVLAVMPWNFPFWQVVRFAAPALVAGNVALLKHASNVPQCALALEDLFARAGAPPGVFQTLLIGSDAVEGVIADPRVAAVTLTGSEHAGRQVAAAAGHHLKKTVLELGGSDPFLVLASADVHHAVGMALKARIINNGQSCIAAKRFIVAAPLYEEFTTRFAAAMDALNVGDPTAADTEVGPLATAKIRDDLTSQVRRAELAGARRLTRRGALPEAGFYFPPTVLVDLPPDAQVAREEMFGPVATVYRAQDLSEAIRLANDTPYGLGASVWGRDPVEIDRCVKEIEAGTVVANGMVASDPRYPFGGIKASGYGRELGSVGLREFVNIKRVRLAPASAGGATRAE